MEDVVTKTTEVQTTIEDQPAPPDENGQDPGAGEPTALVKLAIERNVDVEVLERLVSLQERVTERNARAAFFEAVSAFQKDCPAIEKSAEAKIRTSGGSNYSYTYAPLDEITRTIRPHLRAHGLSYSWTTEQEDKGTLQVICVLRHIDGHEERATFPVPTDTGGKMSAAQKNGAALTYGKRQSLTSVLGLTTSDDVDGAAGIGQVQTIGGEEVKELNELIGEADADVRQFCQYMEVDNLGELTFQQFPKAVRALKRKIKKKEEGDE